MNYFYDKHFINTIWCVRKTKNKKKKTKKKKQKKKNNNNKKHLYIYVICFVMWTVSDMTCQSPDKTCHSSDNTCHSSWISEYPKTIDQWNRVAEKLCPPLVITRAKPN